MEGTELCRFHHLILSGRSLNQKLRSLRILTLLVRYGAGGFAGRLAGRLALAAAALDSALFQVGFIQSFDLFHFKIPISQILMPIL
jgi:hypothetical protein